MVKTRKKYQKPVSNENLPVSKLKSQKVKFKKKKESGQLIPPKKKRLQNKAIVYDIVEDSIIEPKNTSIFYSEEDDSFHEVVQESDPPSGKTSTPLPSRSKAVLPSPKLRLTTKSPPKSQLKTPMRDQVANVSNILSNMSDIMKQISEGNNSFGFKEINSNLDTNEAKTPQLQHQVYDSSEKKSHSIDILNPKEVRLPSDSPESENKTYVSQLEINLSTADKNTNACCSVNSSKNQYDSFLQEFYLNTNPHAVCVKNTKDTSLT